MAFQGRLMWRVLGAAGFILAGQQVTSAAFLPGNIAGGGAGEGIDISGDVVDAIDAVNTGDVIQGVTFTNSASPMVSLTGTTPISTNFTAPTYSGQPDDAALNDVLEGVTYPGGISMVDGQLYKDISFTLAVQQGQAYRLEILLQEVADPYPTYTDRAYPITLSGAASDSVNVDELVVAEGQGAGGITETDTFVANSSSLTISGNLPDPLASSSAFDNTPAINAFILSAVPEPSSIGLVVATAGFLLARRRRSAR
jgi:hypothetical protein